MFQTWQDLVNPLPQILMVESPKPFMFLFNINNMFWLTSLDNEEWENEQLLLVMVIGTPSQRATVAEFCQTKTPEHQTPQHASACHLMFPFWQPKTSKHSRGWHLLVPSAKISPPLILLSISNLLTLYLFFAIVPWKEQWHFRNRGFCISILCTGTIVLCTSFSHFHSSHVASHKADVEARIISAPLFFWF